eukprot:340181-Chlamydomonas_euryale.AAC.1
MPKERPHLHPHSRCASIHANVRAPEQVLQAGGPRLLMSLPRACLVPNFARAESCILAILGNVLEDPATLDAWMESEVCACACLVACPRALPSRP